MPEVRCSEHGVFAYRSTECPGCAYRVVVAREQLATDARNHYYSEIARVKREIEKQRQEYERQLGEAQARLKAHRRMKPEVPSGLGALFKQAAYQRDYDDFLARRAELGAHIEDVKQRSAQYERDIDSFDIAVRVMEWMIATMPKATQLFLAEEERGRQEQLAAQRAKAVIAAACSELDERYGGMHAIGSVGDEYKNCRLLGTVDIERKRYARLQGNMERIVCVPWIDAFAECVGQKVSVRWSEDAKVARVFHVSDADGIIDEEQDRAIDGLAFIK